MRNCTISLLLILVCLPSAALDTAALEKFGSEVEALRGQRFTGAVEHRILKRRDLRGFLADQMEAELPVSPEAYMETLDALFLVEPGATIEVMLDLYDAQVLAFYDPVDHVYYSLDELPPDVVLPEMMIDAVVVHELVHALQDQRHEAGSRSVDLQANWDAALAYQSLLEGEALLVMIAYLGKVMGMSLDDLIEQETIIGAIRESAAAGTNIPAEVPAYFVESLKFPYVDGLGFVVEVYRDGGWGAIDEVHLNPPVSTEELIHPEVYRARIARGADSEETPRSESTDRLVETVLGEFHWTFLLGPEAGEGWNSDLVSVRHGDGGATVLVDSTWDDEDDAREFEDAYQSLLEKNGALNLSVQRDGTRVKAGYGADPQAIGVFAGEDGSSSGRSAND